MGHAECWSELMFDLRCLTKGNAKRQFRNFIKYSFGGLCAYCREQRATTIDHIKPRCKGGSNLRSNLVPACVDCNHSKGSEINWIEWYQRQEFYSKIAQECIEEWITNTRYDIENYDERTDNRTEICLTASPIWNLTDEPPCTWEDSHSIAQVTDGAKERCTADADDQWHYL